MTLDFTRMATTAKQTTFGARLAEARRAAGLTQAQLGEGLGGDGRDLQKATVSSWEVGASQPSAEQLRKLCERLGISADYLLGIAANDSERASA